MSQRPKILIIGEALQPSGYATVLNGLLPLLSCHYDIHLFAVSHRGESVSAPWRVYPNIELGDPWGVCQVERLLAEIRPDIVWVVYDAFVYLLHSQVIQQAYPKPKVVVYCPIDGRDPNPGYLEPLAKVDRVVLFNKTARETVLQASSAPLSIEIIPHGVDTRVFFPLNRQHARQLLFPNRPELQEAFIVLNANRNVLRKRVDLTIEGFANFARNKSPNVLLCLHMDQRNHFELQEIANQLGVADRIICTANADGHPAFTPHQLNLLYNCCEIGINTSAGEGWGLIAFEHAAAGGAQIIPRHSACAELWDRAAVFLEPATPVRHIMAFCEYVDVSGEGVRDSLELLYSDSEVREEFSRAGHALATSGKYDWRNIALQWRSLFSELLSDRD